ncbi:hypothetical protein [Streptacidiphilus jiangxiensis]|uniref:DUF4386 domain-containing protein n=1 Tax=Streptacidiphilus jiangxiensis TaxID=235985 RepID=A0A1H7KSK4_STRJI|nr:hypothetical protein [Streptacidiphilus jiangxiensis]SEK89035.1 hypothetical protein SAMN05414137_104158 [Streptacidiphilus jiangxiensis]
MTTNATRPQSPAVRPRRSALLHPLALTGIAYTVSWTAGLSIGAPSPGMHDSGSSIVAQLRGHSGMMDLQFVLTEGLPAIGLVLICLGLARGAAGTRGARTLGAAGLAAALVSAVQCVLGLLLVSASAPGTVQALWQTTVRLDGAKMLALAVVGAVTAASASFPRFLRLLGGGLAVSLIASALAYGLLLPSLAWLAYPGGLLLLAFVTAAGIVLARARVGRSVS